MENPNSTSPDYTTIHNSILALGRGFDVTADIRLLYCKGAHGSRLIHIDEEHTKDLVIQEGFVIPNVPIDIEWTNGEKYRETSSVLDFSKMATTFNENSEILGNTPLGSFNSMFNFTGCQQIDVATVKALVMDGYFMPLYKVKLTKFPLFLKEDVKHAVPQTWDPLALAKFIENFGTHIITSATIGGQDVIYIKQHPSSLLSELDLLNYVKEIGNQRFLKSGNHLPNEIRRLEDVTVIFRRRGGNELIQSHHEWTETVPGTLDVISMTFFPIVNLLDGSPGLKHLSRAIDLYLEYKPPLEELQYFLDFQIPRVWSPVQDNFPGYQRKEPVCPSLQFSLMGPKLYISCEQVTIGRKPVTGLRLCLEGSKQNRLVIHLQHLASLPKILQPRWDSHVSIGPPKWQGPEEQDSRWFEPIKWKKFSHVSTAPIEYTETCIGDLSGVHIVTGAQLGVWDISDKNILHLKLLFSKVPGCTIRRSVWDRNPSIVSQTQKTDRASTSLNEAKSDSSSQFAKIIKFVDLTEMSKGPQDMPGHWLVTGGKLGVEKGKIILRVKYSLLNY